MYYERLEADILYLNRALIEGSIITGLFFSMPKDQPLDPKGSIDYIGSAFGLGSLILFGVVWK